MVRHLRLLSLWSTTGEQCVARVIDQMVAEGLVVLSDADVIKYAYRPVEVNSAESQVPAAEKKR
jgi:hypothetical protein